jgi:hypothetical protein
MLNKNNDDNMISQKNFNNSNSTKGRIIDQIRGQLNLTPPPTPPASSHQI